MNIQLIDIYDYSNLVERWYLDTYKIEYNTYENQESNFDEKFEMSLGFTFEGTTENYTCIRLNVVNSYKFFLGKVKYGFTTIREESSCSEEIGV